MTRLTLKRLLAMEEALSARLAGEIDDTDCSQADYEAAYDWVSEQIARREGKAA